MGFYLNKTSVLDFKNKTLITTTTMADAIDLHEDEDQFQEEEEDQGIQQLKGRAIRKKGRGLGDAVDRIKLDYEGMDTDSGAAGPAHSVEGWILFVTGVHEEAKEEDLDVKKRSVFSRCVFVGRRVVFFCEGGFF